MPILLSSPPRCCEYFQKCLILVYILEEVNPRSEGQSPDERKTLTHPPLSPAAHNTPCTNSHELPHLFTQQHQQSTRIFFVSLVSH
jgi:hypothetical protein